MEQSYQIKTRRNHPALVDATAMRSAVVDSFRKLAPKTIVKSPVMCIVLAGTLL